VCEVNKEISFIDYYETGVAFCIDIPLEKITFEIMRSISEKNESGTRVIIRENMNSADRCLDNSKTQYQMYGNSVRLTPIEPQALPQNEKLLTRELLADMAKSGKIEEAFDMIWEAIEGFNKRIKELEEK
jgi:hypothetical protein